MNIVTYVENGFHKEENLNASPVGTISVLFIYMKPKIIKRYVIPVIDGGKKMTQLYCKAHPATGRPVRFALYSQKYSKPHPDDKILSTILMDDQLNGTGIIMDMYTDPSHRHKGYISELLNMLQRHKTFDKLFTSWEFSSVAGRQVCIKCGFEKCKLSGQPWLKWERKHEAVAKEEVIE